MKALLLLPLLALSCAGAVTVTVSTNLVPVVTTTTTVLTTNTAPAPPGSAMGFLSDVGNWLSSFNHELSGVFTNDHALLWVGVDSIQGGSQTLVNEIGLAFEPLPSRVLSVEALTRNGGTAGVIVSGQVGLSVNWNIHDVRISLYGDAGYYLEDQFTGLVKDDPLFGEVGIRAFKAIGQYTFMTLGMGFQFPVAHTVFMGGIGIRF